MSFQLVPKSTLNGIMAYSALFLPNSVAFR